MKKISFKKDIKSSFNKFRESVLNTDDEQFERIYVRPSRFKSLLLFVFCLLILYFLIRIGFKINIVYLSILIFDLFFLVLSGINLFTKRGIRLAKYVRIDNDEKDRYRVNKIDNTD